MLRSLDEVHKSTNLHGITVSRHERNRKKRVKSLITHIAMVWWDIMQGTGEVR